MIKFYRLITIWFAWLGYQVGRVEGAARDRWEKLAWEYWETYPLEKAEVERIAVEVVADMKLKERLFGKCECGIHPTHDSECWDGCPVHGAPDR